VKKEIERIEDLDQEELVSFTLKMLHRVIVHYAFWLTQAEKQMGLPRALELLDEAGKKSFEFQMKRLAGFFGFEMIGGKPDFLLKMSRESLLRFMDSVALNWLANDGVWFQAVEFSSGMKEAKRCNDDCMERYSIFEAWDIKKFLNLGERTGLEGLKKALRFRTYARINKQSIVDEGPHSFVFCMNHCRVQSTRKKRGLADYPCKSAGVVEYTTFAAAIDSRIQTECIGCPPDEHPEEWWCAWRFTLPEASEG